MIDQIKFLLEQEAARVIVKQNECAGNADQNGVDECKTLLSRISLLKQTTDYPEHLKVRTDNQN
jgi:hypothetical protein